MIHRISALSLFPHNISGVVIDALHILVNNDFTINIKWHENPNVVVIPPLPSPDLYRRLAPLVEEQRRVLITIEYNNSMETYKVWLIAEDILETFCSWLSFLTESEYKILDWFEGKSVNEDNNLKLIISQNNKCIRDNPFHNGKSSSVLNYNLDKLLTFNVPIESKYSLKNFRRGLIANNHQEQITYFATAIEGISSIIEPQEEEANICPNCGETVNQFKRVSKKPVISYIESLGFTRKQLYNPIWDVRSKFVHADISGLKYNQEEVSLIIKAAKNLFISFYSDYLINKTNIRTITETGNFKNFPHPLNGVKDKIIASFDEVKLIAK
jgi:hypothetical protein